jgi:hypothetical protein
LIIETPIVLQEGKVGMDISKARCAECDRPMAVSKMVCSRCDVRLEGDFEVPALARLSVEGQAFVIAFVRHHGSIKKMESLFGVSYPTVKNRLNAITRELDESFNVPTPNELVLDQLAQGEITVEEALKRLNP